MPAVLSPPAVSEVPVTAPPAPIGSVVDPAFETRWNAWRDRGNRREVAMRRNARLAAIVVALVAGSVYMGLRLLGGTS
jgi:hypothetical protein